MEKQINKQINFFEPEMDSLVRKDHPYRKILELVDFAGLTRQLKFLLNRKYGRPGYIVNHIVFGAVKNPVIASYNLPNSVILSLIHLFILAQNFSIGFKSGEYGGRKIILQPTDSMSS